MKTPIIFIVFNRPDLTRRVFESIRQAQPKKLIVIADGPRPGNENDRINCRLVREIFDSVNWDCEVIRDFSEKNMGCKDRVSTGLSKAFGMVDQAIILEDDCLPNRSFFGFCETLLERYKDDTRVMSISGDNFLFNRRSLITDDYYFSRYPYVWGWATWKRAWDLYDYSLSSWPSKRNRLGLSQDWERKFQQSFENKLNSWATNWTFSCLANDGLTIIPRVNLVSNIGFSKDATHTKMRTVVAEMETEEIGILSRHPQTVAAHERADRISQFHFTRFGVIWDIFKQIFHLN